VFDILTFLILRLGFHASATPFAAAGSSDYVTAEIDAFTRAPASTSVSPEVTQMNRNVLPLVRAAVPGLGRESWKGMLRLPVPDRPI
jgi:hypothetical protein